LSSRREWIRELACDGRDFVGRCLRFTAKEADLLRPIARWAGDPVVVESFPALVGTSEAFGVHESPGVGCGLTQLPAVFLQPTQDSAHLAFLGGELIKRAM
jgi:hypothetical protein